MADKMPMGTVLIGFAEALSAPEVAWSLLDAGHRIVAFSRRGSRPALRHCRGAQLIEVTPPEEDVNASVREIVAAAQSVAATAIMPLDDIAVLLCDRAGESLAECRPIGAIGAAARLALDKRKQILLAEAAGFAVPETSVYDSIDTVTEMQQFPIVVKGALAAEEQEGRIRRANGSVCADREELARVKRHWPSASPVLVQPFVAGIGEGIFGIANGSGVHALSSHRRVRMMNPQGSGSSACESRPVDLKMAACAAAMLGQCRWEGMFMIELLRDESGKPWFMELNGRPWGSMALARRTGCEYPAWALRLAAEPSFTPCAPKLHRPVTCRHLGRELVHVLMVLRGPKSAALTHWPSRWHTIREVLWVRPDERWYNWRRSNPGLFFADTLQTVLGTIQSKRRTA